ncbi:MAG: 2-dehydro-3-deoxyphosphogluconate aldolase [Acidobacteria bacterium]|nr:2-dehydro-3-deoxyphosphogluconate aldolase [Acidobacteriota bacterium]
MIAEEAAQSVADSLGRSPLIAVVRTDSLEVARQQAEELIAGGVALVEITFTVPGASSLVRELLAGRGSAAPPWIGMGSVTTRARAEEAVAAESEFIVSPNAAAAVAEVARAAGRFLILGALTPTEIVAATELGANLVKVYPLPAVGGPSYLRTVRGPLWEVDMLAAGGFGVDEIPAYRAAGASAFGLAAPLLFGTEGSPGKNIAHALTLARGDR